MHRVTLFVFAAFVVAMAMAAGQYYVPRSYYIIDAEGHASPPVPLRRLRRSAAPYPYAHYNPGSSANANANANANARAEGWNGDASANANANAEARAGAGGWNIPGSYGAANPMALRH